MPLNVFAVKHLVELLIICSFLYPLYHSYFSLQSERSFICEDTGALMQEPAKRFFTYKGSISLYTDTHPSLINHSVRPFYSLKLIHSLGGKILFLLFFVFKISLNKSTKSLSF